jgi:hypothetical protein
MGTLKRMKTFDGAIVRHPETRGLTGGPLAVGDPTVTVYKNKLHVCYRDINYNIWHALGDGNWSLHQLTGPGGLTDGPPAVSDPVCLFFEDQSEEMHVYYRDADENIWHISYNGSYGLEQLTGHDSLTGGPAAAGDPAAIFFNGHMRVFYRDNSGIIWYANRASTWSLQPMTGPGSPYVDALAAGDPAAIVYSKTWVIPQYRDQLHLCFRDISGQICYFISDIETGSRSLKRLWGGLPAAGDPVIIIYRGVDDPDEDQLHVFYRDSKGSISHFSYIPPREMHPEGCYYEIAIGTNGKLSGPPAAADPVIIKYFDTLHMFYPDRDGVIWNAIYGGTEWVPNCRFIGPGGEIGGPAAYGPPSVAVHGDNNIYCSLFYRDDGGNISNVSNGNGSWQLRQLTGPRSFRYLRQRFGTLPAESLRALLIRMGPFNPETDAFRFGNKFHFTDEYGKQIAKWFADEIENVAKECGKPFRDIMEDFEIPIVGGILKIPEMVIDSVVDYVIQYIVEILWEIFMNLEGQFSNSTYGRCGGMAFAGYDFYLADWPVDDRLGTTPPDEGVLGDYITDRLFDSLRTEAGKFLEWIMILHVYPIVSWIATQILLAGLTGPIAAAVQLASGEDVDFFHLGGPKELLDKTKAEWTWLKEKLDREAAWPIGIVFGDEYVPWGEHQILAIGYSDAGNGTITLDVWDSNELNNPSLSVAIVRKLTLDFNGDELLVGNFINDKPVKGIFVEEYTPKRPPDSLNFS